jgi:hypothetical protein
MISLLRLIEADEEGPPEIPVPSCVDISSRSFMIFGPWDTCPI